MPEASVSRSALIEWGVATLALPGEAQSGDRHLVKQVGTSVLVAVVDGLGHGAEAATAAQAAVAALERHATESPVPLIERCHRALKGTRGAVMSVALIGRPDRSMTWLVAVRARMMLSCSSPGIWAAPERGDDVTGSHGALAPVRTAEQGGVGALADSRSRRRGRERRRSAAKPAAMGR